MKKFRPKEIWPEELQKLAAKYPKVNNKWEKAVTLLMENNLAEGQKNLQSKTRIK